MPVTESPASRHREAESAVANLLSGDGWQLDASHDSEKHGGADFIIERGSQRYAVEVKALSEGRADRALPLLSLAILQAKVHAHDIAGAKPLAVVGSKIYQINGTSLFSYDPTKDGF